MEKREVCKSKISVLLKMHNNSRFESCALRYSLATANRSSGKEELGRACWGGRLISAPSYHSGPLQLYVSKGLLKVEVIFLEKD